MSWMAKLIYVIGTLLFVLFLKDGHFGLAFAVIALGVLGGLWAIWRHIQAAREREAQQWQVDVTIPMKLRHPKDGRAGKSSK